MPKHQVFKRPRLLALVLVPALFNCINGALHAEETLVDALIPYAKQEYSRAAELLTPLASRGDPVAQLTLGRMYSRGEGVHKNSFIAFEWHLKAAEQEERDAQFELGAMYRDGVGTAADGQLALQWFKRAAAHNVPAALNAIGELYLGHHDVPQDHRSALEWFTKAAEMDSADAMYNIGVLYALGQGVPPDEVEAFKWFDLAAGFDADRTRRNAVMARMALAERLTPMQVWTAKAGAHDWKQPGCCVENVLVQRTTEMNFVKPRSAE